MGFTARMTPVPSKIGRGIEIVSYEKPAMVSRTLPETTAEFMELFTTAVSIPKSGRMDGILYRSR